MVSWCGSSEGRRTSSFKEAKTEKEVGHTGVLLKLNTSQTYPSAAGEKEGTATAILNYPLHCSFHSLPKCPHEKKSPESKRGKEGVRAFLYPLPRGSSVSKEHSLGPAWGGKQLLRKEPCQVKLWV